jgi:hypothetical protein
MKRPVYTIFNLKLIRLLTMQRQFDPGKLSPQLVKNTFTNLTNSLGDLIVENRRLLNNYNSRKYHFTHL